jgi:FtsP/CotA-like multicopper oxidase with cupredoxin domain
MICALKLMSLLFFHCSLCVVSQQRTDLVCESTSAPGTELSQPNSVKSRHGYLDIRLHFKQSDVGGSYCYLSDNFHSPTLRARPGDSMLVTLSNELNLRNNTLMVLPSSEFCLSKIATKSSTNLHFHGIHSAPFCHGDNVLMSVIPSGKSFTYNIEIPVTQPPGLYWYHPHMHTVSYEQVSGGASGLIVIEGIEKINPSVAGLPEQLIAIRDGVSQSVNFVSLGVGALKTAVPMRVQPNEKQFWRIANLGAQSELNLTYTINNVVQKVQIIAIDGVALGDGFHTQSVEVSSVWLTTGGRVEIILTTPPLGSSGLLVNHNVPEGG